MGLVVPHGQSKCWWLGALSDVWRHTLTRLHKHNTTYHVPWLQRYLDNIGRIYDFFAPAKDNYIAAGLLRNEHTQECLYHEGNPVGDKILAVMRNCKGPPVSEEGPEALHWFLTRTPYTGQLRHEATYGSRCLLAYEIKNKARLELVRCYDHETPRGALRWKCVFLCFIFGLIESPPLRLVLQ